MKNNVVLCLTLVLNLYSVLNLKVTVNII